MGLELTKTKTPEQALSRLNLSPLRVLRPKLLEMSQVRDVPLTEYIKKRIREELSRDPSVTQLGLEQKHGISKGFLSQVLGSTSGAGKVTATRLLPLFGLRDYDELVALAYEWWRNEGKTAHEKIAKPEEHMDPERAAAVTFARGAGVPESAIEIVLSQFAAVEGRDRLWWANQFGEVVRAERNLHDRAAREREANGQLRKQHRENQSIGHAHRVAKETADRLETTKKAVKKKKAATG